jgi:hypothetical protein
MLRALTFAMENPVQGKRVMGVPEIRSASRENQRQSRLSAM